LINSIPVGIATFISQVFHAFFAYFLSIVKIFKKKGNPIIFIILYLIAWLLQWFLIIFFLNLGISKLISIVILIPLLALNSYLLQKKFVFK